MALRDNLQGLRALWVTRVHRVCERSVFFFAWRPWVMLDSLTLWYIVQTDYTHQIVFRLRADKKKKIGMEILSHTILVDLETEIKFADNQSLIMPIWWRPHKISSEASWLAIFHATHQLCHMSVPGMWVCTGLSGNLCVWNSHKHCLTCFFPWLTSVWIVSL